MKPSQDRYVTNTQRAMEHVPRVFATQPGNLQSTKWREIRREMSDIKLPRPESREMNAYLKKY